MEELSTIEYLDVLYTSEKEYFEQLVARTQAAMIIAGVKKSTVNIAQDAIKQARATMNCMGYGYYRYLCRIQNYGTQSFDVLAERYLKEQKITQFEYNNLKGL